MKRVVKLNERDLTLIVKKVLSEQARTIQQSIPAVAYKKMIDGAAYWGTDPEDIVDGINMLNSADEFYQMNDMFKDKKTGYRSFDEMIRGEFEYSTGDDKTKVADSNREDIEKITKKLKSLGVPYNFGSKNYLEHFSVLPKPAPATPAAPATQTETKPNWDEVKNYLATKGLPPDFPNKGKVRELSGTVEIKNDKYVVWFFPWGQVDIMFNSEDSSRLYRNIEKTWSWDGSKPVVEGGVNTPEVTKKASGYASTEDEITSGKKILGLGSQGDLVKRVQYEIFFSSDGKKNPGCKTDSTGPKDCDGIYGKLTKKYVSEFQKTEGLSGKDGNVGRETWSFMDPFGMEYEYSKDG